MVTFLYRCPTTGFQVQGWSPKDDAAIEANTYEGIACSACGLVHLVNIKTGKTPSEAERRRGAPS